MFNFVRSGYSSTNLQRKSKRNQRRYARRVARADKLKKGSWYVFNVPFQPYLLSEPDIHSRPMARLPTDAMVMFIRFEDGEPRKLPSSKTAFYKLALVGFGELFGYVCCTFEYEDFHPGQFFKRPLL